MSLVNEIMSQIKFEKDLYLYQSKSEILNYYEHNREYYETVTLHDEEKNKSITKQIHTEINFIDYKDGFEIEITTPTELESRILRAQFIGTAMGVAKDILEYFDVEENSSDKMGFSKKYFNPTNGDIHFRTDMITITGAKELTP